MARIIEMPLPEENPRFDDDSIPSPWKYIDSMRSGDHVHSFNEIFAQLYLEGNLDQDPHESSSSSPYSLSPASSLTSEDLPPHLSASGLDDADVDEAKLRPHLHLHARSDSDSSCNSDRSSICNVDDAVTRVREEVEIGRREKRNRHSERWRGRNGALPPPMPYVAGRSGKPWVFYQSIRQDGRFILTEVRIPHPEFLHEWRQNGRLQLNFVQSDEEEEEEEKEN